MSNAEPRDPHADLDLATRAAKADKILHLLDGRVALEGAKVLEVGTGAGVIAAKLKDRVGPDGELWGVDVVDQRLDPDSVRFVPVENTKLPFPDDSFDLVISNHVIEHVGDAVDQRDHMSEIARVLRPGAWLYLAMPNRWAPVEPHFKLPFLSWLPEGRRSAYVRAMNRGSRYDCRPLTRQALVSLFEHYDLQYTEVSQEAIQAMRVLERQSAPVRALLKMSPALFPLVRPVLPSLVFVAQHPS